MIKSGLPLERTFSKELLQAVRPNMSTITAFQTMLFFIARKDTVKKRNSLKKRCHKGRVGFVYSTSTTGFPKRFS
jgi:hypothetical protein